MASGFGVLGGLVWLVAGLSSGPATAADASAGRLIYQNGVGTTQGCAAGGCHGPSPLANQRNILSAANDPVRITNAMLSDRGGMGVFLSRLSAADIANVAAYIGAVAAGEPTSGVSPSPAALRMPATLVGSRSVPQTVLLTNVSLSPVRVGPAALPAGTGFLLDALTSSCAFAAKDLQPGEACLVGVVHAPARSGPEDAVLGLAVEAAGRIGTLAVPMYGEALAPGQVVPSLSLSSDTVHFGAVGAHEPAALQRVELVNPGARALVLSAPQVSGAAFSVLPAARVTDCPTTGFRTLAAGERCTLGVQFAPPALGQYLGQLRVVAQTADDGTPVEARAALDGVAAVAEGSVDGGGGCTVVTRGRDPGLVLLLVAAVCVAVWRARGRRP